MRKLGKLKNFSELTTYKLRLIYDLIFLCHGFKLWNNYPLDFLILSLSKYIALMVYNIVKIFCKDLSHIVIHACHIASFKRLDLRVIII